MIPTYEQNNCRTQLGLFIVLQSSAEDKSHLFLNLNPISNKQVTLIKVDPMVQTKSTLTSSRAGNWHLNQNPF